MHIYLVGGAVRDQLLGYPFHERDWVVVGGTPQQMLDLGFQQVGKDFPVFLHPETKEEYALARTERKTGPGYTGFDFYASEDVSLEQDLARRDLSINAIAQDQNGNIVDPYQGKQDIDNKVLRHVSPAFCEDPVRILRTARFIARYAHLGFSIAPETQTLMRSMVDQGEADHLVAERCWKEFYRALGEKSPEAFIMCLRECGALERIMPELDQLFGAPQRSELHPDIDRGLHSLMVLQQACLLSDDTQIRFAALIHDIGKTAPLAENLPRQSGHEQHSLPLIKSLCKRLKVPKDYQNLALKVAEYHSQCHLAFELNAKQVFKLIQTMDALRKPDLFLKFLVCCQADSRSRQGFDSSDYPQAKFLQGALTAAQQLSASEFVARGLKGPELGAAIQQARIELIETFILSYPKSKEAQP